MTRRTAAANASADASATATAPTIAPETETARATRATRSTTPRPATARSQSRGRSSPRNASAAASPRPTAPPQSSPSPRRGRSTGASARGAAADGDADALPAKVVVSSPSSTSRAKRTVTSSSRSRSAVRNTVKEDADTRKGGNSVSGSVDVSTGIASAVDSSVEVSVGDSSVDTSVDASTRAPVDASADSPRTTKKTRTASPSPVRGRPAGAVTDVASVRPAPAAAAAATSLSASSAADDTADPDNDDDDDYAELDRLLNEAEHASSVHTQAVAAVPDQCPYLDSVHRAVLDFDFEKVCSVSLTTLNVYACLVCGKYFQGRGKASHAYFHSMEQDHHVFINLSTLKVYCLPDGYEIHESSLNDIKFVINPTFNKEQVARLDTSNTLAYDLHNRRYLPGFVGLNNIKANDYMNVVLQALAHVKLIRNYFLLTDLSQSTELVKRFGLLIRKLWNPRAFKGQVSPHELLQEVTNASQRRFKILQQGDAHEFLAWFLNTLHRDLGGRQTGTSVVFKAFQGEIIMRSRPVDGGDDRSEDGYDDDEEQDGARSRKRNHHTTKTLPFLFLSFDLPPIPLFTDEQDRNIIPQVPLGVLLSKFDGHTEHEVNGELRTYQISRLPQNLILHFKRFERNNFTFEKNPTIVNFPVRAVDVRALLAPGSPAAREAEGGGGGAMGAVYDLVANVCHGGKAPAAAASTSSGGGGVYKVHVLDKVGEQQWYQIQDLLVEETIPQTIFLAESYIQIWERNVGGPSSMGQTDTTMQIVNDDDEYRR